MYKNIPVCRCGDEVFFGNPSNDYIVKINIDSYKVSNNIRLPDSVSVRLVNSESAARGQIFRDIKFSRKKSIYEAIDLALIWLSRCEPKVLSGR